MSGEHSHSEVSTVPQGEEVKGQVEGQGLKDYEQLVSSETCQSKTDVSASTLARMMGVATATDLQVLERKVDLLLTRVGALNTRMERVLAALNNAPTGSDLERIDVQVGALRTLIKEVLQSAALASDEVKKIGAEMGQSGGLKGEKSRGA